jgi:hypothetical protein
MWDCVSITMSKESPALKRVLPGKEDGKQPGVEHVRGVRAVNSGGGGVGLQYSGKGKKERESAMQGVYLWKECSRQRDHKRS